MNDNDKQPETGGNPWMKQLLVWVAILLGLALFVTMIDGRSAQPSGDVIAREFQRFLRQRGPDDASS